MSKRTPWVFVDCEARGTSPVHGVLTEFGAVHYDTRETFHGRLFEATPGPGQPGDQHRRRARGDGHEVAASFASWLREHVGNSRPVFMSDNPAYDWQWIAGMFDRAGMDNPFGHSGRRISDFWAGLNRNWSERRAGSGSGGQSTTTTQSMTRWGTWRRSRRSCASRMPLRPDRALFVGLVFGLRAPPTIVAGGFVAMCLGFR